MALRYFNKNGSNSLFELKVDGRVYEKYPCESYDALEVKMINDAYYFKKDVTTKNDNIPGGLLAQYLADCDDPDDYREGEDNGIAADNCVELYYGLHDKENKFYYGECELER